MEEDSGRPFGQPALSPSATEPLSGVSAHSGDGQAQVDCPPHMIALVDLFEGLGDPIWRVEVGGKAADFADSETANNFAEAINDAALAAISAYEAQRITPMGQLYRKMVGANGGRE